MDTCPGGRERGREGREGRERGREGGREGGEGEREGRGGRGGREGGRGGREGGREGGRVQDQVESQVACEVYGLYVHPCTLETGPWRCKKRILGNKWNKGKRGKRWARIGMDTVYISAGVLQQLPGMVKLKYLSSYSCAYPDSTLRT